MIEYYNSIKRHYCNALAQQPSNSFYQNFPLKNKQTKNMRNKYGTFLHLSYALNCKKIIIA